MAGGRIQRVHRCQEGGFETIEKLGVDVVGRKPTTFPCFTESVLARVSTGEQEYHERAKNGAMRQAIGTLQLERTPWEIVLYGKDGGIEGERWAGDVPAFLIRSAVNSRKALRQKWGKAADTYTLEQMAEELAKDLKEMVKMEWGFQIDAKFLMSHAIPVTIQITTKKVWAKLPDTDNHSFTLETCIRDVREIRALPHVVRSTKTLRSDVDSVLEFLVAIRGTNGPAARQVESLSPLLKGALTRIDMFLQYPVTAKAAVGTLMFAPRKFLAGRSAVEVILEDWSHVKRAESRSNHLSLESIRRYRWMFPEQVYLETQQYLQEARTAAASTIQSLKDGDEDEDGTSPKGKQLCLKNPAKSKLSSSIASQCLTKMDTPYKKDKFSESKHHLSDLFASAHDTTTG